MIALNGMLPARFSVFFADLSLSENKNRNMTFSSFDFQFPINLAWTAIFLLIVLALRSLLDLEVGATLIRILNRVPSRRIFGHKYHDLKGPWGHTWEGETGSYLAEKDRHGHHEIYQFGRWLFAATRSRDRVFHAFGRIQGEYIVGRWYDNADDAGYFGAFQFRIVDSSRLEGKWIGHSKENPALIRHGEWKWKKMPR